MSLEQFKLERWINKDSNRLESWAWPGVYPIYYIDGFNSALCPDCANQYYKEPHEDERFNPKYGDINYEDNWLFCEKCNKQIECAYKNEEETGENENE